MKRPHFFLTTIILSSFLQSQNTYGFKIKDINNTGDWHVRNAQPPDLITL